MRPAEGGPCLQLRRQYLLSKGYDSERPWTDFVIGSRTADGRAASGWLLRNAGLPALVRAEDSETAYLTQRAIDFIESRGDIPWSLHLSYIKPHWPFKAPAPYHDLFGPEDCPPAGAQRRRTGRAAPCLRRVPAAGIRHFRARRDVAHGATVYMGPVKQIDDELGPLLDRLERLGRLDDTLIVFTSDHGDLAGDHWLGEKERWSMALRACRDA